MADMWSDSDYVEQSPHLGDKSAYFPTVNTIKSIDFGRIKLDENSDDVQIVELMLSTNVLRVNDDPTGYFASRIFKFLNIIENLRKFEEPK